MNEPLGHQFGVYLFDESSGDSGAFEKLGDLRNLSGIKMSADTIEDKEYDEGANEWDEFSSTMKRLEEMTLTIRRDKDTATNNKSDQSDRLMDLTQIGEKHQFQIVSPSRYSKTLTFHAVVTALEIKTEARSVVDVMYTIKPSGAPTMVASS